MSVFLSLIAGFASGIGAAIQSFMAHDKSKVTGELRKRGCTQEGLDRQRKTCRACAPCFVLLYVPDDESCGCRANRRPPLLCVRYTDAFRGIVAGAMTAPRLAFVLAGALSITLRMPPQSEKQ